MKLIDKEYFWNNLSKPILPLSQSQKSNIDKIIDYYDENSMMNLRCFASLLAQIRVESANTYNSIREYGSYKYFKYLIGKLGIKTLQQAWEYRGFGHIQITGIINFNNFTEILSEKYGEFVNVWKIANDNVDTNYRFKISLDIAFIGCENGYFTGKKLGDYFTDSKTDWFNARRVVNPGEIKRKPKKVWEMVEVSKKFYKALEFRQ